MIGGLEVDNLTRDELAARMVADAKTAGERPRLVFSVNGEGVSRAASDNVFRAAMQQADIRHADGMSVVFASRLFSATPLTERVATTDFFHDAAAAAEKVGLSFYFLGGTEETARAAFDTARKMYPNLRWAGYRSGYFSQSDEPAICREIVASGADILWVGLGRPKQEAFCLRNADRLKGVTWLKTCGGLFDFLAGNNRRAPAWMQATGLEWLYRTLQEPRRLLRRYLTTNPHAIWLFATQSKEGFRTDP